MVNSDTNDKRRSIVYVFDSLRKDYVGCYSDTGITPNIDSVANDGVKFDNAHSQGFWTVPSSASIFSGLYPDAHQSNQFNQSLEKSLPRITDGANSEDITTACFSTTNVISKERGFDYGFDEFYQFGKEKAGLEPDIGDRLNEELLPWIDNHSEEEFFVLVWTLGTHYPYRTPSYQLPESGIDGGQETMRRAPIDQFGTIDELYSDNIKYNDRIFGGLLDTLKSNSIYNEVDLFITSDHGEVFTEHARLENGYKVTKGILSRVIPDATKRYYGLFEESAFIGHQAILPYEELISVPLIAKLSGQKSSESVSEVVELIDIPKTVNNLFDYSAEKMQGVDLQHLVESNDPDVGDRCSYSSSQITGGSLIYRSVQNKNNKLTQLELKKNGLDVSSRNLESLLAYLLSRDYCLFEINRGSDDIAENKEIRGRLKNKLREHVEECGKLNDELSTGSSEVDLNNETLKQLEDLGYKA